MCIEKDICANYCMYYSDLNISMPFSSTGIEAAYCNKRSFYYDSLNKFPNSIYENIPYFVAHNIAQATQYLKHWITQTDDDVRMYIEKYFNKEFNMDNREMNSFDIIKNTINN